MRESAPSSPARAERAFFRWQSVLGSYEYARQHGSPAVTEVLARQAAERYDEHAAPRDGLRRPASRFADPHPGVGQCPTTSLAAHPRAGSEAGKPPIH